MRFKLFFCRMFGHADLEMVETYTEEKHRRDFLFAGRYVVPLRHYETVRTGKAKCLRCGAITVGTTYQRSWN